MNSVITMLAMVLVLTSTVGYAQIATLSQALVEEDSRQVTDPIDQVLGEPWVSPGEAPPHQQYEGTPNLAMMGDDELWRLINRVDPQQHRVLVAIKEPRSRRGFFRGTVLVSSETLRKAREELFTSIPGIGPYEDEVASEILLANGAVLPVLQVRVDSYEAFLALRQWQYLDFIEPMLMFYDTLACGFDAYTRSSDPRAQDSNLPGLAPTPDLVPYVYALHKVQDVWARFAFPGQEQGIAVLDSGISSRQDQFFSRYTLFHPRRPHLRLNRTMETIDDACFHGTKVASIAAAPRDGRSVVGIAWNAPLTTVKIAHAPLILGNSRVGSICGGITDAVTPPNGRPPARVVAMAFGLDYFSPTIAACIGTAFSSSPGTVFVVAAGSTVSSVTFPANLDAFVLAVSLVELTPGSTDFRLMGRPGTVAYGPEVDFVSPMTTTGIPSAGVVGDSTTDEIAQFRWSSAATGVYAGLVSIAGQYAAQRGWTRAQLISALRQAASRQGITDFSGEPLEAVVGSGIVDLYRAVGGARSVTFNGPYQVAAGQSFTMQAEPDAVIPPGAQLPAHFGYRWLMNGSIVGSSRTVTSVAPSSGVIDVTVFVFDSVDGTSRQASRQVLVVPQVSPSRARTLFWSSYVADFATLLNGGRHDRVVNSGVLMPQGCLVQDVRGLLMCSIAGGSIVPCAGETPQATINRSSVGFTVTRSVGIPQNSLEANVHQWHDGLSAVRTKTVYTVSQPAGVDCVVVGVLTSSAQPSPPPCPSGQKCCGAVINSICDGQCVPPAASCP